VKFLSQLARNSHYMLLTFAGFLRAWQKQIDFDVLTPLESKEFLAEIDERYAPFSNQLVFKKAAS
jgi:hypothetical protein